ncbi:MAG: response regulator [Candidatus Margulisiibacteriota bacterium]
MPDLPKILLLEDEALQLNRMVSILSPYATLFAKETQAETLVVLAENPDIALIITDFKFPDGDGNSLIKALVAQGQVPPIILQSAHMAPLDMVLPEYRSYVVAVLEKPFGRSVFLDLVLAQIQGSPKIDPKL